MCQVPYKQLNLFWFCTYVHLYAHTRFHLVICLVIIEWHNVFLIFFYYDFFVCVGEREGRAGAEGEKKRISNRLYAQEGA